MDIYLEKVSGGKKTITEVNFYDIESKSQKGCLRIVNGKEEGSWGLNTLNDGDKAALKKRREVPDYIKNKYC